MDLRREKKRAIMRYAGYVAGTLGVGGLSALLSRGGMEAFAHLKKPSFSPPGWVFPAAWTLLYILMAVSAAMIAGERTKQSRDALFTYWAQLFVNFWWSIFFFAWRLRLTAFFWLLLLLALAVAMAFRFGNIPSRSRKIEHSVSPVAGFRRRVEYIGIHFKQVKRFRMARNWFAGQFFVKTCFS